MSLNYMKILTPKVVQKTWFLVILIIKPPPYSDIINYYDDYITPIDNALADNKGVEYPVVPNYEYTND